MHEQATTTLSEWKRGWPLVLASFLGFLSYSVMIAGTSAFMGPLAEEFGWSRTLLSSGTAVSAIITALCSPFLGAMIDRYGSRRLALPGLVLSAASLAAMATNNGSAAWWVSLWLIYAASGLLVTTPIWAAAVAGMFNKSRGLALAAALAGATAAHAVIPPLSVVLIDAFGWRIAFVLLGAGWGTLSFVVCYLFLFDAHDRKAVAAVSAGRVPNPAALFPGLTLAQAWHSTALWRIAISILVIMSLTIGFLVHQIEILVGLGVSRHSAAELAGLAGAMGMVGKMVTGLLVDRLPGRWVGGATMAIAGFAFYLLLRGEQTSAVVTLAMLVNGYTAGAKLHIVSYLTAQYSGMRNFGKIYGFISSMVAVGSGAGPIIAGMLFDATGNYHGFLIAGAAGLFLSALLLLSLPRAPDWVQA